MELTNSPQICQVRGVTPGRAEWAILHSTLQSLQGSHAVVKLDHGFRAAGGFGALAVTENICGHRLLETPVGIAEVPRDHGIIERLAPELEQNVGVACVSGIGRRL